VAEGMRFAETRLTLISLAESYQHMALALEHVEAVSDNGPNK
jgi:hypothetical protein